MYRSRLWTMRQYAGFSSAKATNERFKLLLERGQMGLSVAFDLPTQLGMDADDELSFGEVGKVGVSISSVEDMKLLFDGIPIDSVSTSMTINSPAMVLLAMYIVAAEEQGVSMENLKGDDPKRHSQRVHRPRDLCISAKTKHAIDHRYLCLLR